MISGVIGFHKTTRPHNGMHPTANSVAPMREAWMLVQLSARRVMPGVRCYTFCKIEY